MVVDKEVAKEKEMLPDKEVAKEKGMIPQLAIAVTADEVGRVRRQR